MFVRNQLKCRGSHEIIRFSRMKMMKKKNTMYFYYYRNLVTTSNRGSWSSLTESQQSAWKILGWEADSWEGRRLPPASSTTPWSRLTTTQQAAAKYGLGYSQQSWDRTLQGTTERAAEVATRDRDNLPQSAQHQQQEAQPTVQVDPSLFQTTNNNKSSKGSFLSTLAQTAYNVFTHMAPTVTEHMSPPIEIATVETTIYLDDSPSMSEWTDWFSFTSRLDLGKKVLAALTPALGPWPCRILKFSNKPTVLSPRQSANKIIANNKLPAITAGWDASGNGTYLWHMIETDVLERYRPPPATAGGGGKLRLVVVTDGEDNMSPYPEYNGMRGMDPMMRKLSQAGYDIEWHIILIGSGGGSAEQSGVSLEQRYKALAGATGGSFLQLQEEFDPDSKEARVLLDAIRNSTDEQGRRERQRRYEKASSAGKLDKVDWYKRLPAGDNNKK